MVLQIVYFLSLGMIDLLHKNAKALMVLCLSLMLACEPYTPLPEAVAVLDISIDTSAVPRDTLNYDEAEMQLINGKYLVNEKPFSGIVHRTLKGYPIETYSSVLDGSLHGTYRSFYASGKPYEVRTYREGLSVGRHFAYWEESGHLKFEYNYYNQKKEGAQKSWYSNGSLAYSYFYQDDHLEGLQQAWRKNGSLYRNFEVKNGARYGLQKAKSCYELSDEELILQSSKTVSN